MDERNVTEQDVYREHMASVNPAAQWAYLFGVLAASFLLMLLFVAWLGAAT